MDLESLNTRSVVITERFDAAILMSSFKMNQPTSCWNTANYQQHTTKGLWCNEWTNHICSV